MYYDRSQLRLVFSNNKGLLGSHEPDVNQIWLTANGEIVRVLSLAQYSTGELKAGLSMTIRQGETARKIFVPDKLLNIVVRG